MMGQGIAFVTASGYGMSGDNALTRNNEVSGCLTGVYNGDLTLTMLADHLESCDKYIVSHGLSARNNLNGLYLLDTDPSITNASACLELGSPFPSKSTSIQNCWIDAIRPAINLVSTPDGNCAPPHIISGDPVVVGCNGTNFQETTSVPTNWVRFDYRDAVSNEYDPGVFYVTNALLGGDPRIPVGMALPTNNASSFRLFVPAQLPAEKRFVVRTYWVCPPTGDDANVFQIGMAMYGSDGSRYAVSDPVDDTLVTLQNPSPTNRFFAFTHHLNMSWIPSSYPWDVPQHLSIWRRNHPSYNTTNATPIFFIGAEAQVR
jgi:hypothetical protein